jgi:endonuclease-8
MPEGDTVFHTARVLDEALGGKVLDRCDIRVPAFATVDLTGERVESVLSVGKHLLHRIGEVTIHSHLKMEGSWEVYPAAAKWRHPVWQARAILGVPGTVAVGFQLGELEVVSREREADLVGYLGPDILGPGWDADIAVRNLTAQPTRAIGLALLDQRNLAGLGNVYRNELCFLRGILPTRPVGEVLDVTGLVGLAHRVILANRDRFERSTTGDLRRGQRTWVHGREHEPCRRCGTIIRQGALGDTELTERQTFFCPSCQR